MAKRRMFSLDVVDTDAFLDLPASSQNLYFHLGMRADDDGFISSPKRIAATVAASADDLKLLVAKGFIIPFDSGVCVVRDWKVNNYIQGDRYTPSLYKEEKAHLGLDENRRYSMLDTVCIQDGYTGKVRLGKDRLNTFGLGSAEPNEKKFFPPDSDAYMAACCLRDEIASRLPTASPPSEKQLQSWADAFDKCHRLDGHGWDEIEQVLLFSQSDKFWQQNILSGEKFRKQYTSLLARMEGG